MPLPGVSSLPADSEHSPSSFIATTSAAASAASTATASVAAAAAAAASAGVVDVRMLAAPASKETVSNDREKRDDCVVEVEGPEAMGAPPASATAARGPPGFSELWESWKDAACCLHSLSKVACYPSAAAVLGPALGVDLQEAKSAASCLVLSPHFAAAGKTEYPNAKAVLSYKAFKKSLALMFVGWAEDSAFPALFALKDEDQAAHPGILEFFARFLAVRLFFVLDPGRRGFVRARDLLSDEDFQLLLNSLYKPLGSPLEDLPAQWSLQFAYDIFNFLREKDFVASRAVVAELLEALSAVVCSYTYDCTSAALARLFSSCTLLSWRPLQQQKRQGPLWAEWPDPQRSMQQQQQQQQQQEQQEAETREDETAQDVILSLSTEDLIRFLASLDFCAAVWGPTPLKARVVSPPCVSAALRFLWDVLDVEAKGHLSPEDISELSGAVCETLNSRGYPASSLLKGSLEAEMADRLQANSQSIDKHRCINNHTLKDLE